MKTQVASARKKMVFISHSTNDSEFVAEMVDLLRKMGLTSENLFCSSFPGYGIPTGEDIYEFLRRCFTDYELYVVLMISKENYYSSPASLNEMGAAWVLGTTCVPVLLPGMKPGDMRGAVNSSRLALILDSDDAKYRLTEFRTSVCSFLGIDAAADPTWDHDKDDYVEKVRGIKIQGGERAHEAKTSGNVIDRLIDGEITLENALLKLKVAARRAGNDETAEWAERELCGYADTEQLPDYRKISCYNLTYTGFNGALQVKNNPLPMGLLDEDTLKKIMKVTINQGISTIEDAVQADKKIVYDRTYLAPEVSVNSEQLVSCAAIVQTVPINCYETVLAEVKNKAIDELSPYES